MYGRKDCEGACYENQIVLKLGLEDFRSHSIFSFVLVKITLLYFSLCLLALTFFKLTFDKTSLGLTQGYLRLSFVKNRNQAFGSWSDGLSVLGLRPQMARFLRDDISSRMSKCIKIHTRAINEDRIHEREPHVGSLISDRYTKAIQVTTGAKVEPTIRPSPHSYNEFGGNLESIVTPTRQFFLAG